MNKILTRQLKKLGLSELLQPASLSTWQEFIHHVDQYYNELDADRYRIERSMDISSNEMHELNHKLQMDNIEIARLNSQLIDTARRAGMAEISTSVLHNIGNVLNSANTTAEFIKEELNNLIYNRISAISQLLNEHQDHFADYIKNNAAGKKFPEYIIALNKRIIQSNECMKTEIESLITNLHHISEITVMHKSISGITGIKENIRLSKVIDEAIAICAIDLKANNIHLSKNIYNDITLSLDRHKLIQIIINLIKNAIDSLVACPGLSEKKITITSEISQNDDNTTLSLAVEDNGSGIEPDVLGQLFKFGFTTKKNGHGFGLHGSAITAKELNAKLIAESKGHMQGAKFILLINVPILTGVI